MNSGKTTLLRALAAEIPPRERIVTIEQAFELGLERAPERHPDMVALEARPANVEGEGQISVADLVRRALRMNADRVIVGEVLGDEVLPMLNAMSQGRSGSMCTVHADSSAGVFRRIASYAVQAPERLPLEATQPADCRRHAPRGVPRISRAATRRPGRPGPLASSESDREWDRLGCPGEAGRESVPGAVSHRHALRLVDPRGGRCRGIAGDLERDLRAGPDRRARSTRRFDPRRCTGAGRASVMSRQPSRTSELDMIALVTSSAASASALGTVGLVRPTAERPGQNDQLDGPIGRRRGAVRAPLLVLVRARRCGSRLGDRLARRLRSSAAAAMFGLPKLFGQSAGSVSVEKIEAIASWTEMLQGTLAASAGLNQAIVATAPLAPAAASVRPR